MSEESPPLSIDEFQAALQRLGRSVVTASQVARVLDCSHAEASERLATLAEAGRIASADVSDDPVVWYPTDLDAFASREHRILFAERREVVVEHPRQFTRAQLAQFAHLVDSSGDAYIYRIREEDVWQAPYDHLEDLLRTMRDVLPERSPHLEAWVERQWGRAHKFTLATHEEGYTVLRAASDDLMGNVALQKLEQGEHVRAPITDSEVWVASERVGEIKRILYDAGYPVQDERELASGDPLDIDVTLDLRAYQRSWVERFESAHSGVFVGPPGSGKTVAAMGAMASVGGETLILVPSRDLARQWHEELLAHTSLTADQIGEYHGGEKNIRPVTIATYQTAGMDRHRTLFDEREWGLIVYDEVHHVPSRVFRRSTDLQAKHRLGLSVDGDTIVPVRRGAEVTLERIADLVSTYLDDTVGVAPVGDAETLAVTGDGNVTWTKVTAAMRHENDADLYNVRASNGREVTVTEDHSLMVFDGTTSSITSKRPLELSGSDYLIQPATVPIAGDSETFDAIERVPWVSRTTGADVKPVRSGVSGRSRLGQYERDALTERSEAGFEWLANYDVAFLAVDSVEPAEHEEYVYDLSTREGNFLGNHLFCHNSATPVREDEKEADIFTLIGPPIGTDWAALFDAGFVAEPEVEIRYVPWADEYARNEYVSTHGHERRQVAATNPAKIEAVRTILEAHAGSKLLIFADYLDQGDALSEALDVPFVSGEMRHSRRQVLFDEFRTDRRDVLVISRVGDEGIDLPNAEVAIVVSGLGGSRRQGAQRAGRTMRPVGSALMYVLATRGTNEEDFARQQLRHLAGKGIRVTERDAPQIEVVVDADAENEGSDGTEPLDEAEDAEDENDDGD